VSAPRAYDLLRPLTDPERIARLEERVELLVRALEIELEARELTETRLDELDAVIWRAFREQRRQTRTCRAIYGGRRAR
jgi:hypothetical protein